MRINLKKIFTMVSVITIGAIFTTPMVTLAETNTNVNILGGDNGGGTVYKIDSFISEKDKAAAEQTLRDDPDKVANILTAVVKDPKLALQSPEYRAIVNAFKNAPSAVVEAVKKSTSLGKSALASFQNSKELRDQMRQIFGDAGNFFENITKLVDVRDNQDNGNQTISNGISGTPSVLQSSMYQTLLPSIIYSRSQASNSAGATTVSLSDISKYSVYNDSNSAQRYGFVEKQKKATPQGTQLANYIKALYEYDYLVPIPKNMNDGNPVSKFFNSIIRYVQNGPTYTPSGIALSMASFFGSIYDAATSFLKIIFQGVTSLNWNAILGFSKNGRATGFVDGILQFISDRLGFSSGLLTVLRYFVITVIMISFVIFVIVAAGARSRARIRKGLVSFAVRIVVIFVFIPISGLFTDLLGQMASGLTSDFTLPSKVNSMFVLDTLDWAATTNLSLAPITNASPSQVPADISAYEPTFENVQKLTQNVIQRAEVAGLNADKTSAADLLNKVSSQEVVSVNAYFSRLASAQSVGSSSIAASNLPNSISTYKNPDGSDAKITTPIENVSPAFLSTKESSEGEESGASNSDSALAISRWQVNSGSKDTLLQLDSKSKMVVEPIRWYNLDTYIYGARLPDTMAKEHANYSNFINSTGTSQLNDPRSGKSASGALKDALTVNANIIALFNQYGGVSKITPGGDASLSTQSVAFLLQSDYSNGALTYRGYNTIASKTGETKNTGVNGNAFVRYVIPNSSETDLISKVYSLLTLWMCSAVVAVYALIWVLKGPIIKTMMITAKSFIKAALTGDITAAIKYLAGDMAIKFSATFAAIGTYMTLGIMAGIINSMQQSSPAQLINGTVAKIPIIGDFIGSVAALIGGMFICIILTLALVWPIMRLNLGGRGRTQKPLYAGFLGIFIMIPYILFEALDEYLDIIYQRVYGKSKSRTFAAKLGNQTEAINQKQLVGNLAKNAGVMAAKAGIASVTGGASTAITNVMGGTGAKLAAHAGKTLLGAKSAVNRFGGDLLNGVADFTGAPTGTEKDGFLRTWADGLHNKADGLANEADGVDIPTLGDAIKRQAEFKELENLDKIDDVKIARDEAGLSVSQRVMNKYERDRDGLIDANGETAIKNIDELAKSLADAQGKSESNQKDKSIDAGTVEFANDVATEKVSIQSAQATTSGSTVGSGESSTLSDTVRDGSLSSTTSAETSKAERLIGDLNQAVSAMDSRLEARKDVYISDAERNQLDSPSAVANREAIRKMQTSLTEAVSTYTELSKKLDKANALRDAYANDPEKVAKIDGHIERLVATKNAVKARMDKISSYADTQLEKRIQLDVDNEKIAAKIDKSVHAGLQGIARHAVTAIHDVATNQDNAKALRDDWDRRVANRPESEAEYQARKAQANEKQSNISEESINALKNEIAGLREESEYTNEMLVNGGIKR